VSRCIGEPLVGIRMGGKIARLRKNPNRVADAPCARNRLTRKVGDWCCTEGLWGK